MAGNTYASERPRTQRLTTRVALAIGLSVGVLTLGTTLANAAQPSVDLGAAGSFALLAGSGITNTGSTTVTGDIGSHPTPAQTGTGPCPAADCVTLDGTNHADDAVTQSAKADLVTAYDDAAGRTPVTTIATELGGQTLAPGVYDSAAGTFQITGTLTLDAGGDADQIFIFQAASTLITASASDVSLLGGAQACNIFWTVGSSATLGTNSSLSGNILALTDITATTNAAVVGSLLARNGAVTLDTDRITRATCAAPAPAVTPTTAAAPTPSPTPAGVNPATPPQTTKTPVGGVDTGGGSTAAGRDLGAVLTGSGVLAAGVGMLALRRRVDRKRRPN